MRRIVRVLATTVVGGVLFLVPVVLIVVLAAQALRIAGVILAPLAHLIPGQSIAGVALANVVAATLLVVTCFVAGMAARTAMGRHVNERFERLILRRVPGFTFVKSAAQGLVGLETGSDVQSALARIEDAWVPAFVIERHHSGLLTVFVPSVPTPAAGTVYLLEAERVRLLDVPVTAVLKVVMALGVGLRDLVETPRGPAPEFEPGATWA